MLFMQIRNNKYKKHKFLYFANKESMIFSLTLLKPNIKECFLYAVERKVNFSCKEKQLSHKNKLKK